MEVKLLITKQQFDKIDYYLDIIFGLGADYDGCNSVESLKGLIDELVEYANKARKVLHNKENQS